MLVLSIKEFGSLVSGIADTYAEYEKMQEALDKQYEEPGFGKYLAESIRAFYR